MCTIRPPLPSLLSPSFRTKIDRSPTLLAGLGPSQNFLEASPSTTTRGEHWYLPRTLRVTAGCRTWSLLCMPQKKSTTATASLSACPAKPWPGTSTISWCIGNLWVLCFSIASGRPFLPTEQDLGFKVICSSTPRVGRLFRFASACVDSFPLRFGVQVVPWHQVALRGPAGICVRGSVLSRIWSSFVPVHRCANLEHGNVFSLWWPSYKRWRSFPC